MKVVFDGIDLSLESESPEDRVTIERIVEVVATRNSHFSLGPIRANSMGFKIWLPLQDPVDSETTKK